MDTLGDIVRGMLVSTIFLFVLCLISIVFDAAAWVTLTLMGVALVNLCLGQLAFLVEYGKARNKPPKAPALEYGYSSWCAMCGKWLVRDGKHRDECQCASRKE